LRKTVHITGTLAKHRNFTLMATLEGGRGRYILFFLIVLVEWLFLEMAAARSVFK
jgi:hypothetical protein